MGDHTTDSAPEDLRWGTQVEGTVTGVDIGALAQELVVFD